MAVSKGMSLAMSCCQPPNRSAISLNNTYSASFDDMKDAAYTAKYGHPLEMKLGRGRGEGEGGKGRGGKGREKGRGGRAASRGWKGEGRDGKKEVDGGEEGRFAARGVERGGEEGKGRRNGELTLTPNPNRPTRRYNTE